MSEGWAPVEAPLPLLAQTQIRSQRGARLGSEVHGKRQAGAGPASRCLAHCTLLRIDISLSNAEHASTWLCGPHQKQTLWLLVPLVLAKHAYCPPMIPLQSINQPLSGCPAGCVRATQFQASLRFTCSVLFLCLSLIILPGF